jgi:antitoxin (DNA-binding transcriptional repressor) of toxin-antitoxin stability system
VKTITTHEAKTHLSRYLAAIEQGEEFIIARGKKPVAILSPIPKAETRFRPKVGEMLDRPMSIPDSVFAPLTEEELKVWYE